jgi:Ni,Fe-hydrogenase III large subunit/Ni,Fe-hydrogenase III component G
MSATLTGGDDAGTHRVRRTIATSELSNDAAALLGAGFRLALVAAHDDGPVLRVVYLFLAGTPDRRVELEVLLPAGDPQLPSLAGQSFPAGRFEREMADLFGISPVGHPAPRRLVRHAHWPENWHPMRHDAGVPPDFTESGSYPFVTVEGPGVYEIPVGPIHAGIIEPGHFRFSVLGETIIKLKARLWFVHRGIEKLFEGRPATDSVALAERISGDTAAAHALAHTLAVEDALNITVPEQIQRLRALLVELERLYNHAADLGALANDVGLSLANGHAQRVREQLLRINDAVTGHRLLRDGIYPGGTSLRSLPSIAQLRSIGADLADITQLTLSNSIVRDRFTGTAILDPADARDLGCLGYVARASGLSIDARIDHPTVHLPVRSITATSGDVLARYTLRRDEFAASVELACHLIEQSAGDLGQTREAPDTSAVRGQHTRVRSGVGIAEGWRGTIVHRVEIDPEDRISRVKIVDPSWFNWPALPVALTDTIVPDFPLANKSFNLSYAGNDL